MKRRWILSVMIMLLGIPSLSLAGDDQLPWERKLPFKTAIITYSIKGMENGKQTLYIRDYGKERAIYRETTSNMMGMKMINRTVEFRTPEQIYTYDLEKRQGSKGVNPQKYMIEEYDRLSAGEKEKIRENAETMGVACAQGMGGTMQRNAAKLLGFDCDKIGTKGGSSTYLIHDTDVALKTEMNMMGMKLTMVAESVDKGGVDEKFFKHPEGIKAEASSESDKMAQNMARQSIAMLKDPEKAKAMPMMPQLAVPGAEISAEDKKMMEQVQQMMKGMQGKRTQ